MVYGYFDIQSKIGLSKHVGGLEATKRLLELCRVDDSKHVLVVGSGNGTSAAAIERLTKSRVAGIDVSGEMVEEARKKSSGRVEFKLGDAEDIPFPDNTFDAVLSESVTAFTDKKKSLREYHRVLKEGGYVGLNEVTWLDEPPKEIRDYAVKVIGGLHPETREGWLSLINGAGFVGVADSVGPMNKLRQLWGELRMQGLQIPIIWGRFFYLYFFDVEYRRAVHRLSADAIRMPRGFMKYFGYGLYAGRK